MQSRPPRRGKSRIAALAVALALGGALASTSAAPALAQGERRPQTAPTFHWKGVARPLAEAREILSEAAARALAEHGEWAHAHAHACHLSDDQRVLLLVPGRSAAAPLLARVEEVAAWVDAKLPAPPGRPRELRAPSGGIRVEHEDGSWEEYWEDDGGPLEVETAVIAVLGTPDDQERFVAHLAASSAYLGEFAERAKSLAGFTLERPLVAAFLTRHPVNEEFSADAELVHRTACLLMLRRFSQQPFWLQTGLCWQVEMELRKGELWCFPYRDEFIYTVEHARWPSDLKKAFKDRARRPLAIAEVAAWRRGSFDGAAGLKAWGVARVLVRDHAEALPAILEELRAHRQQHGRRSTGESSWERIPGYEVPAEVQLEILVRHAGPDFLEKASQAFREGLGPAEPPEKGRRGR